MKSILSALLMLAACSKSAPSSPASTQTSPNAAALKQLQEQRDAPPVNQSSTVGGDDLERMTAFSFVKAPSTPGNPSHLELCATLYDKTGREVAAEGDFSVTSDLEFSGGQYVHAPMFGPIALPGYSSTLGACPSGGELWPPRLEQLSGKTFPIQLKFTSESGKVLFAETSQSF